MTTTPPLIDRAWQAVPGVSELTTALAAVRARQAAPGRPPSLVPLATELADRLASGERLPDDDLDEAAWRQLHAAEARNAGFVLVREVAAQLENRLDQAKARGVDQAFAVLRDELNEILTATRAVVRTLGTVASAQAAIDAGGKAPAAWKEFTALVSRYRDLQAAQHTVTKVALPNESPQRIRQFVDSVGAVRNFADLDPERALREENRHAPQSWPSDPQAYLRWLVGPEAEPWLPTGRELLAADADRLRRREEADLARARRKGRAPAHSNQHQPYETIITN